MVGGLAGCIYMLFSYCNPLNNIIQTKDIVEMFILLINK